MGRVSLSCTVSVCPHLLYSGHPSHSLPIINCSCTLGFFLMHFPWSQMAQPLGSYPRDSIRLLYIRDKSSWGLSPAQERWDK